MDDYIKYENETFDIERALYGSSGVEVVNCRFDGPADGESALKESRDIVARDCYFNLRYPFWHDDNVEISNGEMTSLCRAALWYSNNIRISGSRLHGIKALRECSNVKMEGCDIISPEFGWSTRGISMKDTSAEGEYFMMRSENLEFENVNFKGKYSFQYITDSTFVNCRFDTKDAFWHARNILVKDSVIKGEYLAWYSENITFENCVIIGTQPLCYCKGLKMINCSMEEADLAFEKTEVEAEIVNEMISIKNPKSGTIKVAGLGQIIMDDPQAKGQIIVG
ncbi:MAG: DUF3737 family protein [Eubacterium sp.]|nr:DUF3737 family protein [Eubacterium sp.]